MFPNIYNIHHYSKILAILNKPCCDIIENGELIFMTYVVPNYFKQNNYNNLIQIDNLYCLKYITKQKSDFVQVRTTMHSLVVLIEGNKIVHINNTDIKVNNDEITLLTQNNYYMSERITSNNQYKSFLIYFDDDFIFDFIKEFKIDINTSDENELLKLNYKKDISLNNTINEFQNFIDNNFDKNLLKLKIHEIFLHIYRIDKNNLISFFNSILNTAQDRTSFILESNIDILQNISDMCNITSLSQNQLRTYIKKRHSTTPKVYLDKQRIQKAKLLLSNNDDSISSIATSCGYSTVSWFIAQFKKYTNTTPKDFRYKS